MSWLSIFAAHSSAQSPSVVTTGGDFFSSENASSHPEDEISDQVQVVQLLLLGPAIGSFGDRSFARPFVKVGL